VVAVPHSKTGMDAELGMLVGQELQTLTAKGGSTRGVRGHASQNFFLEI